MALATFIAGRIPAGDGSQEDGAEMTSDEPLDEDAIRCIDRLQNPAFQDVSASTGCRGQI